MKKVFTRGGFIAVIALFLCGMAAFAACNTSEIKRINTNWGTNLPADIEIEYSYDSSGWFGDGVYYYVCSADKSALGVDFTKDETGKVDEIVTYNSALLEDIDGNYFVDCSHDLELYRLTENDGSDSLNLIYDNDINKLIILEIHI